jgi:hypothetical protein
VISVIIPTIDVRARWLDECVAAYEATCPGCEIIIIRDQDSCGEAWILGAQEATGDYLHFTADDLLPLEGWWEAAIEVADAGGIPGANVLTAKEVGGDWLEDSTMYAGAFTHDDRTVRNILVPFLTRERVATDEWLLPIHYGSDDWVTYLADLLEIPIPFTESYRLGHGAAPQGRLHTSRWKDLPLLADRMMARGGVPFPYKRMAMEYGWQEEVAA